MEIGIFGGSFNPIHNGHIALAETFLKEALLDEVWLMVAPQNPFKINQQLLEDAKRFELAKEALINYPHLVASNYEFSLPKPSYTWNTLQQLAISYPLHNFTLLIGGDNWQAFDRWNHAEDILANYQICVYPRKDDTFDETSLPKNVRCLHAPLLNISSTMIREWVQLEKPINDLVPENIVRKIELYYK